MAKRRIAICWAKIFGKIALNRLHCDVRNIDVKSGLRVDGS
jgi:hypothetical protein